MLDAANYFLSALFETYRLMFRGRLWLPLLLLTLVQGIMLYAHHRFFLPAIAPLFSGWLQLFSEEIRQGYGHYPEQYVLLPQVFGWAKLGVAFLLEGPLLFLVAARFGQLIRPELVPPLPSIPARWLRAITFWLLINGLWVSISIFLPELLAGQLDGPKRMLLFSYVLLPSTYMLILCPFYYAIPAMAVQGDTVGQAFARSWRLFLSRPVATILLSVWVLLLPALLSAVVSAPTRLVEQFQPEIIVWLFAVILIAEMVASFFWMGTAVRYLLTPRR